MVSYSKAKFESIKWLCLLIFCCCAFYSNANSLASTVKKVSPSVVAVGLKTPLEYKGSKVLGTGFAIGKGNYVVTNYHVVSEPLAVDIVQHYVVLSGTGQVVKELKAEVVAIDPVHDIAILALKGTVAGLSLGEDTLLDIGTDIAFTGFPIGSILGLYPATHRGIIAAITPDAIPAHNADVLTLSLLKRLKTPSLIYQLDATAYPGNSGSPVFSIEDGSVVAIINKVIVKDAKESALSSPSGISYAVPVARINALVKKHKLVL